MTDQRKEKGIFMSHFGNYGTQKSIRATGTSPVVSLHRPTTGASMNPVRTLGPAVAAGNYRAIWIYLTAPILGALCGAGIYTAVKLPDEGGNDHEKPSTFA